MATITLTIGTSSKSFTVSNSDMTRMINAMKTRYERGLSGTTLNTAQVFDTWANEVVATLVNTVVNEEGETAATNARNAVPAIPVT